MSVNKKRLKGIQDFIEQTDWDGICENRHETKAEGNYLLKETASTTRYSHWKVLEVAAWRNSQGYAASK